MVGVSHVMHLVGNRERAPTSQIFQKPKSHRQRAPNTAKTACLMKKINLLVTFEAKLGPKSLEIFIDTTIAITLWNPKLGQDFNYHHILLFLMCFIHIFKVGRVMCIYCQWAIVAYMGVARGVDTKMVSNHYKTPVNEIRIIKSIIHLDKQ